MLKNNTIISIIICTYNRGQILADTLVSYAKLKRPLETDIELLIIDNNSNDQTSDIVHQFMQEHSETHYILEPKLGLSYARNRGITEAKGDFIAFVDDDVFFSQQWLVQLEKTFRNPSVDCFGGKSIPVFNNGEPMWLTESIKLIYGSTNSGELEKEMIYPEHPFGLNMAFKKGVFSKVGNFNPRLGRVGGSLLSNEEADLFFRIDKAGLKTVYNPKAQLYHRIPDDRATPEWVLDRFYWQGISEVAFNQIVHPVSRYSLLIKACKEIFTFVRLATGGNWNPRKAYWHFLSLPLSTKIKHQISFGKARQLIREAIRTDHSRDNQPCLYEDMKTSPRK